MRYRDITDEFEDETEEERHRRYACQYGGEAEKDVEDAETMLLRAEAEKVRAETQAILRKAEEEHDEIMLRRAQELVDIRMGHKGQPRDR